MKSFPLDKAKAGENYPPMHPNCRSTTMADTKPLKRLARGSDGKNYTVDGNLSYKDWYEGLSSDEQGRMKLENKKDANKKKDKEEYNLYKKLLGKSMPSLADYKESKYNRDEIYLDIKKRVDDIKNTPIRVTNKQFGKKIGKHGGYDYGFDIKTKEGREQYRALIEDVRYNFDERAVGDWRSQEEPVIFYIKGENLVVTQLDGEFISLFDGGKKNERAKNARRF